MDTATRVPRTDQLATPEARIRDSAVYYRICSQYSFAVPTDEALDALVALSPLLDLGCGNGYWPALLTERGADVLAVDPGVGRRPWFDVTRGDHRAVRHHPDRALLMVWPSKGQQWAADAVRAYKGSTVAYLGDPGYRETANHNLPRALRAGRFTLAADIEVASWRDYFTDRLQIWKR